MAKWAVGSMVKGMAKRERIFSRELVAQLNAFEGRLWTELLRGKELTEMWIAQKLRPFVSNPGPSDQGRHRRLNGYN